MPLGWSDMDRDQVARGIASTVPQLLSIQVETAHPDTSDAVALAVERIAEELLRWHDRIAIGADHRATAPNDRSASTLPALPAPATRIDPAMTALRASIERGVIPGAPRTLQLAASELSGAQHRIENITGSFPDVSNADDPLVLAHCEELAAALRHHEDVLLRETDRLRHATADTQRVQVFARVVRAERGLARTAMTTLAP